MLFAALLVFTGSMNVLRIDSADDNENDNGENSNNQENKPLAGLMQQFDNKQLHEPCPEKWNGTIPHSTYCSQYHRCENGIETLLECDSGLLFDYQALECVLAETVKCKPSLQPAQVEANKTDVCKKQVDGFYPLYAQNCLQYLRCQSGRTVSTNSCQDGHAFNFHEQVCTPQHTVACVLPTCHPEDNEFFWLPGSLCRSYYYCQEGTALSFNCPQGKEFSKDNKDCVVGGQCYEPICTGKSDGNHSDTTHDCKRSLQCRGGVLEGVTSCPPGQVHNGRSCLPAALARCDRPEDTAVSVEAIHDDCRGYSDGAHVLPATDCRRYQFCQDGKALARFSCPPGRRFNGTHCAMEKVTPCEDLCAGKQDGYQADMTEGCRKYHFCRGGHTTDRRSCPEGSLFSGSMCLPAPLVSCEQEVVLSINPCQGLPDGFHADYLHGCNQYFYCYGYSSVLRTSCPKLSIWNGKQCVPPKDTLCLGPEPSRECHGLPTGLYQDKASGCENYFYCHNGNRTLLSCPKGKVFDGSACVAEDEYICPSREPKTCYNKTDGYRTDEESGCRAYYYCSNGHKTTYICPGGEVFNGSTCLPTNAYSCPFTYSACNLKPNGYHPDPRTTCRKYFFCHDGSQLNSLSCGARKVFDGTRCVFTTNPNESCRISALKDSIVNPVYYK